MALSPWRPTMVGVYKALFILAAATLVLADADDKDFDDDHDDHATSTRLSSTLLSTTTGAIATATPAAEGLGDGGERGGDDGWYERLISVHGVVGVLAFAVMFPLGGVIIRLLKNSLWKHAGMMLTAYAAALFTLGTGIYIAQQEGDMGEAHAVVGILVVAGLFLQPFSGYIHHRLFVKTGGRTSMSYAHMWIGIPLITIGIVNGLLGLRLADKKVSVQAAYAVVALLIWIGWMASSFISQRRRGRAAAAAAAAEEEESVRMQKFGSDPGHNGGGGGHVPLVAYPGPFGDTSQQPPQADYVPYIPPAAAAPAYGNSQRV